jgi:glycine cleavage system aminomethyltransferase T
VTGVAAPGTPVAIEIRGRQLPARIVARPFYRRVRREE